MYVYNVTLKRNYKEFEINCRDGDMQLLHCLEYKIKDITQVRTLYGVIYAGICELDRLHTFPAVVCHPRLPRVAVQD